MPLSYLEFHRSELKTVSDLYSLSAKFGILYLLYCRVKSQYCKEETYDSYDWSMIDSGAWETVDMR